MFNTIKDIEAGKMDEIIVLIKSITPLKSQNGSPYQKIIVRDRDGNETTFLRFDQLMDLVPPAIIRARIECTAYGASLSMKVRDYKETNECRMSDFLPKAHIDAKKGWNEIVKQTRTIRSSLCRIVCAILSDDKTKLMHLPLNPIGAFARQSGVLEATVKLVVLAEKAAQAHAYVDRDLLISASILYYSGELETIDEGYSSTIVDLMYGPAMSAFTKIQAKSSELIMADEKAREDISGEDIMMLSHILSVKNGNVSPAIPEAVILKHLDKMLQETDEMIDLLANSDMQVTVDTKNINKRAYKRSSELVQNIQEQQNEEPQQNS